MKKCGQRVYPRAFYPNFPTGMSKTTEHEISAADRRAAEREVEIQAAAYREFKPTC